MEDALDVDCPYCGEPSTVNADGDEEFVMDCPVCCRPWKVRIRYRPDGTAEASVSAEGE